jgi:DNA repair exonuclease SbcCD ATPase subunit
MLKPKIIETGVKTITKIYHVSDIHIRNFKRHEEYKRVFKKLAEYIQSTKDEGSVICVTGDVVHSKTDITPELVQEVQDFLKLMSSILPTIVIPGNHDANLNNSHRMDSLSPIINAMGDDNIIFIKDSGVFRIANIDFVHWSVFDEPKSYIKASKVKSDFKICLYHGAVNNSLTEMDFSLTGNNISNSDFAGFDLVLLGDIHKRQFLNEEKTIAYPGSLIQQNHGESLEHGIMVWDTVSKSGEFVDIENDTAFYTLYVEHGIHLDLPETLPSNLYLRLRSKNTSPSMIKEIAAEIKKSRNIVELSHQTMNDFSATSMHQQSSMVNVRDVSYQNTLLEEYLKNKFDLSKEEILKVCELNSIINGSLPKTEVTRNIQWSPKRFEFSNMFSYGKNNVIDFSNMEGVYGIFAQNASGKSSSIEALVYCLFDKCSKTSKAGLVMNNKSREFHCKLDFELDGKVYTIERKASYRSKTENVKQDVNFFYVDTEGHLVSLNGRDRSDTNAMIRGVIGSYEDFVLTSMSMQNNNTGFIDMSQTERKDLLSQFLDIKVFEDLFFHANESLKEYSILIKEYKKNDYFSILKDLESNSEKYSKEYRELTLEKEKVEKTIEEKTRVSTDLASKLVKVDYEIVDISKLESLKASLLESKSKTQDQKEESESLLENIKIELTEVENEAQRVNVLTLNDNKIELQKLTNREKQLSLEVERLKTELTHKLEKMKKLEDLKYDTNCKFCMENVFVKDAITTKDSIEQDKENAKSVVSDLKLLRESIDSLKSIVKEQETVNSNLTKKKNDRIKVEGDINRCALELHQKDQSIKDIDNKVNQYKEKEAAIKSNYEITLSLGILQGEIKELKYEFQTLNENLMTCNTNIQITQKEKENAQQSIENLKTLEDKFKYYEYYLSAMGRDGLPYELISSIIPRIQEDINNILSQVVDFQISIQSDGKNINAYITYDDERKWPIELSSGMEKFVSSLAIRSSLINTTSLPRPNFLAIDEGFGALDQSNMGNISILLDYLKTQFKFIVMISHIDSIRDVVDSHIEITKGKDGFSKVHHE